MTTNTYAERDLIRAAVMKSDDGGLTWYADPTGGAAASGVTSVDGMTGVVSLAGSYDPLGAAAAAQAASQPLDSDLTSIAALATTSYGRGHLTEANAAAGIAYLGLDADLATFSLPASTTITAFGASLVDDANAAAAIATLGLDADIATLSLPASTTITTFGASLIDDANAAAAIATLGLDADISTLSLPASTTISTFGASLVDDTTAILARVTLDAQGALSPTTVKTATTYTTAAGELVRLDTTSNAITVTLPTAPADKTVIAFRLITGTNTVTINSAGGDVFTVAGGGTSFTMAVAGEGLEIQYQSSGAIWHLVSNRAPRTEVWWQNTAPVVSANDNFMQVKSSAWVSRTPAQAGDDLFGAWTAFTPTVTQGATITLTSNNSRYFQIGKTVYGIVRFVAGSSGTTNSAIRVSMPVTPFASGINPASGTGTVFDTSTTTRIKFWVQNSTSAALFNFFASENFNNHENGELGTAAFVYSQMASGDVMTFFFLYEAA